MLYGSEKEEFFLKNGTVAWGVVPTSEIVEEETPEGLAQKLSSATGSALVTPACGVGTLDERLARKVFETARRVSEIMRKI